MPPLPADSPPTSSGLPRPPGNPGRGLPGLVVSYGQLGKLFREHLPNLAWRLAHDVDVHRGSGHLP